MTLEIGLPESSRPDGSRGRNEGNRPRRGGMARWSMRGVLALLAVVILTPLVVAARVWYDARQDSHPKSDAIIVLGAAQYNGRPSPTLEWRPAPGPRLQNRGGAPAILRDGGR